MKVRIKQNGYTQEILCPDGAFFVGVNCTVSGVNVINVADTPAILGNMFASARCDVMETVLPTGDKIVLYCYVSDNPEISEIIDSYRGMRMFEICFGGLEFDITM